MTSTLKKNKRLCKSEAVNGLETSLQPADPASPPTHVAIIMDGNGRWAKARGLPRFAGHKRGAEAVRHAVKAAREMGIGYLTLYAFSSENWKRPRSEVEDLMGLLRLYLKKELNDLHKNNVRFRVIGDRARLAPDIVTLIDEAELMTEANSGLTLSIALNYGARSEIVFAARRLAAEALQHGLDIEEIDEDVFSRYLDTADIPDPDLLIRTSGEKRLSNFLLWQSAYTEFIFLESHWPDFNRDSLEQAVHEYFRRERRYGATS